MTNKINKIDDNTIEVVKTTTIESTTQFTYEELIAQKKAIQNQKDEQMAQRDAELAEIEDLLSQCTTLNVVARPDPVVKVGP